MEHSTLLSRLLDELMSLVEVPPDSKEPVSSILATVRDLTTNREQRSLARTLSVRCFGKFAINNGALWTSGPSLKKGQEFIQYLVAHSKTSVRQETLADAFWPEVDIDMAAHRIHLAASGARSALRQVLGGFDAIQHVGGSYRLHPTILVDSDVSQFEACHNSNDIDRMRSGVSIYAGAFLVGNEADWLQPLRARYASMHVTMLERLADHSMRERDYLQSLAYAHDLIGVDRGHEGACRLMMRSYAALGRRTEAIAEYEILRSYLHKHLGVEPTRDTTTLLAAIRDDSWTSSLTENTWAAESTSCGGAIPRR